MVLRIAAVSATLSYYQTAFADLLISQHPTRSIMSSRAVFISLVLLLAVSGCTEDRTILVDPLTSSYPVPGGNSIAVPYVEYNSLNPYDSLGLVHNEAVVYALHYLSDSSYFESAEALMNRVNEGFKAYFVNERGWLTEGDADSLFDSAMSFIVTHQSDMKDPSALANFTSSDYSARELYYIHRIGAVIALPSPTYDVVADSLESIENDIVAESWGPTEYRALKVISVAKYSFHLWSSIAAQAQDLNGGTPVWTTHDVLCAASGDIYYETYIAGYDDRMMPIFATRPVYKIGLASIWDFACDIGNGTWSVIKKVGNFFASLWPF